MKARVKATGEIVDVSAIEIDSKKYYSNNSKSIYGIDELDFGFEPDYWEKLKHQYAGMAMQGLLGSRNHYAELTPNQIALDVCKYATALVNKLKEEQQ